MKLKNQLRFLAETAKLLRSQWWAPKRIRNFQDKRLVNIMRHAVRHVPRYRALGIDHRSICSRANLASFPPIAKAELQDNPNAFRCLDLPGRQQFSSRTSGTTGEPTTTYFDQRTWVMCRYALKARRILNVGNPFGQRLLVASERSDNTAAALRTANWGGRLFSTLNICIEDPIAESAASLARFRPTIIHGYPSYLEYLAEATLDGPFELPNVPTIFTSGETVTEEVRNRLEGAYKGRVVDVYGTTEFKEVAVQCAMGQYHINFESVFVESYPEREFGHPQILLTSVVNTAMPLIRYDIGDYGYLKDGPCACGRSGPMIGSPQGRKSEMLQFPGGLSVSSYTLTTIVGAYPEIKNYTIVHRAPLDISLQVFATPPLDQNRRATLLRHVARELPDNVLLSIDDQPDRLTGTKRVVMRRDF